ncbi:hypothetical protein BD410DRAFT_846589 [Rickenella mellea]|uniref:Uncharacterized protein n=1 Tax=Rickenella mellea TaxID=50990 RepID=A0A4Y7PGZ7_9AGAM|nr:hypothetical protein BD410DRAFT_846589 [Rickenella mellea]
MHAPTATVTTLTNQPPSGFPIEADVDMGETGKTPLARVNFEEEEYYDVGSSMALFETAGGSDGRQGTMSSSDGMPADVVLFHGDDDIGRGSTKEKPSSSAGKMRDSRSAHPREDARIAGSRRTQNHPSSIIENDNHPAQREDEDMDEDGGDGEYASSSNNDGNGQDDSMEIESSDDGEVSEAGDNESSDGDNESSDGDNESSDRGNESSDGENKSSEGENKSSDGDEESPDRDDDSGYESWHGLTGKTPIEQKLDKVIKHVKALEKQASERHDRSRRPGKKRKDWTENLFRRNIRQHVRVLMNRKDKNLPPPPEMKEVLWFKESKTGGGPTEDNWSYNYLQEPEDKWNVAALRVFITTFIRDHDYDDKKAVEAAFKSHMKYLATQYRQEEGRKKLNDYQAALSRLMEARKAKQNNRRGRRHTLLEQRILGAGRCRNLRAVKILADVVERLGVDGMSEDETDTEKNAKTGGRTYRVTSPRWRSKAPEFLAVLKTFDLLYTSTKYRLEDYKPVQGNWTRMRLDGGGREPEFTSEVPKGLPRNCYDNAWLAELDEWQLEALGIQEPVKLDIPEKVLQFASRYVRCYERKDTPTRPPLDATPVPGNQTEGTAKPMTASREKKAAKSRAIKQARNDEFERYERQMKVHEETHHIEAEGGAKKPKKKRKGKGTATEKRKKRNIEDEEGETVEMNVESDVSVEY